MSYFQAPQGYNEGYNGMDRSVGPKPHSVMPYPHEIRNTNPPPRSFDQRNMNVVDPRADFRTMENNRYQGSQYQNQQQPAMPPRPIDPRQAEMRAMEARNALNPRGMDSRPMVSVSNPTDIRSFDSRPMERSGGINPRLDPRMGFNNNSLSSNMGANNSPVQSSPPVNPVIGPPVLLPPPPSSVFHRPSVSETVQIPPELSSFAADPKFQQILLRVKEQTLINFISLNRLSDDSVESVAIDSSTKEAAQLAKNLIETHLKLQLKVKAAETRLQRVQTDLFSTQGEIAAGQMVDFTIGADLIGLAIGKKGSRIKQIETETGVSSINVNDNGHITIYGPDSQSVQQAREQLELVEESFNLRPIQVDWLSEKINSAVLMDLKKDASLMVARVNKESNSLEIVGTNSSVQLTKFLLATQLEYIDKQIEIEANEREAREKLNAVRKQYGLNGGPWRGRQGDRENSDRQENRQYFDRQENRQNSHRQDNRQYSDRQESRQYSDRQDNRQNSGRQSSNMPMAPSDAPKKATPYSQDKIKTSMKDAERATNHHGTIDEFTHGKSVGDPLEGLITYSPADVEGKKLESRRKGKDQVNEAKPLDNKDRKQNKTRTVEITISKTNEIDTTNKSKPEKASKSQSKMDKNNNTDVSTLLVVPPPPLLAVPPQPSSTDKNSGKGKKNKKQDGPKEDDKGEKKNKESMLLKINNPFQEQTSNSKAQPQPLEDTNIDIPEITFPKSVSGPPKEPPARVVTLKPTVSRTSSDQKNKDKDSAELEESAGANTEKSQKTSASNRDRDRKRNRNNSTLESKVEIISIVTKEQQDICSDLSNVKLEEGSDLPKADAKKSRNKRRQRNEKDGSGSKEGGNDNATPSSTPETDPATPDKGKQDGTSVVNSST